MLPRAVVRGRKNPACLGLAGRLQESRQQANLDGKALSLLAGLTHDTVYRIEQQGRFPSVKTVEMLAVALKVSPCWLAYGVQGPCSPVDTPRCLSLATRLNQARTAGGLSCRVLAVNAGTSSTTISRAEKAETFLGIDTLEKIAKALKVSPCWLAYGEDVGQITKIDNQPTAEVD